MNPLIEIQHIQKVYPKNIIAIPHIHLSIPQGRIVGFVGATKSGKSTLLQIIAGIVAPTHGNILINGNTLSVSEKKLISFSSQQLYLNRNMTVSEWTDSFSLLFDDFRAETALQLFHIFQIDISRKISSLPLELRVKTQLILTFSRNVPIYLLDEPLSCVSPELRNAILKTMLPYRPAESTVIVSTTHPFGMEEYIQDIVLLKNGCVFFTDAIDHISSHSGKSLNELYSEVLV